MEGIVGIMEGMEELVEELAVDLAEDLREPSAPTKRGSSSWILWFPKAWRGNQVEVMGIRLLRLAAEAMGGLVVVAAGVVPAPQLTVPPPDRLSRSAPTRQQRRETRD